MSFAPSHERFVRTLPLLDEREDVGIERQRAGGNVLGLHA